MSNQFSKDELYALPLAELVDFSFDEKTVAVFPDMINRSVPGYSLIQSLTGLIAAKIVIPQTNVYDLGCSLGASSLSVMNSVQHQEYELIMVDQSESMIANCRRIFSKHHTDVLVHINQTDIRDIEMTNASMIMLNLVLQFVPLEARNDLLKNIYHGLNDDGGLLLSEKVSFDIEQDEQKIDDLYIEFKKRSGYSDLEISQKRQALEKVMQIESVDAHIERLKQIGFKQVFAVMQALNFVSILALK